MAQGPHARAPLLLGHGQRPVERLRRALDVNLFGVWHLCQAVVPGMVERQYGRIMNLMGPIPEQPAPFGRVT